MKRQITLGDNELEFICWMELYKIRNGKYTIGINEVDILNRENFLKI